jgi:hypothetical protein
MNKQQRLWRKLVRLTKGRTIEFREEDWKASPNASPPYTEAEKVIRTIRAWGQSAYAQAVDDCGEENEAERLISGVDRNFT